MERLKSLNSPLPKKVDKPKDKPVRKAPFEPQRPVNARSQSPAQSLGELTKTIRNPIPSMPKSDDPSEDIPPLLRPKARKPADEQSASTRFSWFGGGKKDQVEEEPSEPAPAPVPAPSPAPAARSIPSPPPAPKAAPPKPKREPVRERKGPIRMQLPLGDEEEDEPLLTEGMTIGEIMKRRNAESGDQGARSKKWGVDMSRFQD